MFSVLGLWVTQKARKPGWYHKTTWGGLFSLPPFSSFIFASVVHTWMACPREETCRLWSRGGEQDLPWLRQIQRKVPKPNAFHTLWDSTPGSGLPIFCYWRRDEGFPQLPSSHTKPQVLETHKHEKHFEVSHNNESYKVEVLARIYFSITGCSRTRWGWGETFSNLHAGNRSKDSKWGFSVLYFLGMEESTP
jgi:hypothetical protein